MIELQKMTRAEQRDVERVIRAIAAATEGEPPEAVAQALAFTLFGTIRTELRLSMHQAVKYCARYIDAYAKKVEQEDVN